jgi:hypothetical protein
MCALCQLLAYNSSTDLLTRRSWWIRSSRKAYRPRFAWESGLATRGSASACCPCTSLAAILTDMDGGLCGAVASPGVSPFTRLARLSLNIIRQLSLRRLPSSPRLVCNSPSPWVPLSRHANMYIQGD